MAVSEAGSPGRAHDAGARKHDAGPRAQGGADRVRRENLALVLAALHRQGPLSRAELTRRSGLNRSTISALVAELSELRLTFETEPDAAGRVGRPSPLVHANDRVAALAIHPDVDAVTVGLVGLGGRVHRRIRREASAPPSVAEAASISKAIVEDLRPTWQPWTGSSGVGVAVPGLVRQSDGEVLLAPHLNWENEPLTAVLGQALQLPVAAANDASLGSLAESLYGAAAGASEVIYLNGSASGIGGGIITGGAPVGRRGRLCRRTGAHLGQQRRPALPLRAHGLPGNGGQPRSAARDAGPGTGRPGPA